jgi:exopolysaccharide biosynthesis predicted pyruvyltransferase EpsI
MYSNAVCLIDPTLQIEREHWLGLAAKRLVKEKYLLLMLLYNEDNGATEYAQNIARQRGLKVVKLSWEYKKPSGVDILMTHRSPQEFLSLFQHAEFIVTNSFHGLTFSINLNKQFIVVPRNEFNTRIESLLRLVHLEDRMISEVSQLPEANKSIKYDTVNSILDNERQKAKLFLKEALK